ncbi:MAG TPA: VC0807 family protein [Acetobacteraceae bacterium]|nr:VC0807 family protein [Acetobacteraceae bacterium]
MSLSKRLAEYRRRITRQRVFFALELVVNLALPWAFYRLAKPYMGEARAIMVSAIPPTAWSLAEFARRRVVDALSVMVLGGIALSLIGFALGGSPRLLLMRESLITGLIGLIFLGSALVGRPLVYILAHAAAARRGAAEQAELRAEAEAPGFKRLMTIITIVWGCGLVAETCVRALLAFSIPVARFLVIGPAIGYATVGLLIGWTFLFARRRSA